jgi:lipoprotein-releasing system permease protein
MNVPFELHIAFRYLVAKRKQAFISVISFISTLGVTVGVMALVIALALMTGLMQEVRDRILASNPHVYVWKRGGITDYRAEADRLRQMPRVLGAAPAILDQTLVFGRGISSPIQIKGIDPGIEQQVTDIRGAIRSGSLDDLASADDRSPGVLLGKQLAAKMGVSIGDLVNVISPELAPTGLALRPRPLRVAGTFELGLPEFDSTYGFMAIEDAKRLFGKTDIDFIQLRVDDIWAAPEIAARIHDSGEGDYLTEDWADMNQSLFSALSLERKAISLAIALIVMVAALNIVASLILMVMEKHRDIAILKTMGASARSIMIVFMLQGVIIGIIGTTVGTIAGVVAATVADRYKLVSVAQDIYMVSHMPFTVRPIDLVMVVSAAMLICFVATIYPSRQAARLDPAQALRYE